MTAEQCTICKKLYNTSPFANMSGDGELLYSHINIYGTNYNLCPKCTWELYKFLEAEKNG